jgi:beta-glucosidase
VNQAWLEALHTGQLKVSMPGLASLNVKIDGAANSTEFVGVNYYTRSHLKFIPKKPFVEMKFNDVGKRGLTDIGWEQYPEGFFELLLQLKKYGQPVWVTENGIDDRTGARRSEFLYRHWEQLLRARAAGVDIRTYLHWSLFDNFEWLEGWGPRFGLYRVDFETLERTPTPSVEYFRRVATSRMLSAP